jgi:hypothetical protein
LTADIDSPPNDARGALAGGPDGVAPAFDSP